MSTIGYAILVAVFLGFLLVTNGCPSIADGVRYQMTDEKTWECEDQ